MHVDAQCGRRPSGRRPRVVLLTGPPGAGKTTLCRTVVETAWRRRLGVAGLLTESRTLASGRVVQTVVNLRTGERRRLAEYVGEDEGEPVGSGVAGRFSWQFVSDSVRWGRHELERCIGREVDLLVIDQIGPLEVVAGSGWTNALAVLGEARAGLSLVVVNPLVIDELRRRLDVDGATVTEVDTSSRGVIPEHLAAAAGWSTVMGQALLSGVPADLLATDLDGTVLGPGGDLLAPELPTAVRHLAASGITLVLCTGRSTEYALEGAQALGASSGYGLSYGGAMTVDLSTGNVISRTRLTGQLASQIVRLARELGLAVDPIPRCGDPVRLLLTGAPAAIDRAAESLACVIRRQVVMLRPTPEALAVQAAGATKHAALAALTKALGVDEGRTVYLGDADDDAGALRWAGLGIAMSAGTTAARGAADLEVPAERVPEMLVRVALARRLNGPS